MKCTTRTMIEIPVATWEKIKKGESSKPYCAFLESLIDTQLSTKLDADDVILNIPQIGEGTYGIVYRGEYRGQMLQ